MVRVRPTRSRATVGETSEGFEISIPARKNPFAIVFLPVWSVGWAFGEVFAVRTLLATPAGSSAPILFMVVWLTAWTLGGGFCIYTLLWLLFGREVIVLRPDALVIRRLVLGVGRSREYDLTEVRNLRVATFPYNPFDFRSGLQFWGITGGVVAFDYGAGTVRFGNAVEEGEAGDLVGNLKRRHQFAGS